MVKLLFVMERAIGSNSRCRFQTMKEHLMKDRSVNKTILVVEDDPAIREVLVYAFQDTKCYHIMTANDGFEALKLLEGVRPILCLLDYNLPSMNGIQLYDRIHSIQGLENVRALLMSANLPEQDMEKRHLEGINKPFDLDVLLEDIERLLA